MKSKYYFEFHDDYETHEFFADLLVFFRRNLHYSIDYSDSYGNVFYLDDLKGPSLLRFTVDEYDNTIIVTVQPLCPSAKWLLRNFRKKFYPK